MRVRTSCITRAFKSRYRLTTPPGSRRGVDYYYHYHYHYHYYYTRTRTRQRNPSEPPFRNHWSGTVLA